jgi:hypothetical protein
MLGSTDPHRFRKTVAGACMVLAPAMGLVGFIVSPGYESSSAKQLATIAADRDQWFVSEMLILLGLVALVPAVLGLMHMLREREVTHGHLGGGLALIGTMAAIGSTATAFVAWQMTATAANVALLERLNDTAGFAIPFYIAVFALPLGLVVLSWGLMRAEAAHPVAVMCLAFGPLVAGVGFATSTMWLLIAGYAVLFVGMGMIGRMVLEETVDDWEHTPRFQAAAHTS